MQTLYAIINGLINSKLVIEPVGTFWNWARAYGAKEKPSDSIQFDNGTNESTRPAYSATLPLPAPTDDAITMTLMYKIELKTDTSKYGATNL